MKYRFTSLSLFLIFISFLMAYFIFVPSGNKDKLGFTLGLDLSGGTQLVYKADMSSIDTKDIPQSLEALKNTIERRVNAFGVSEPLVQTELGSSLSDDAKYRLIVELPGFTDTKKAVRALGKTPVLEFKPQLEKVDPDTGKPLFGKAILTGAHLKKARALKGSVDASGVPEVYVSLTFNSEGKEIFAKYTKENVGKVFGIFLDGNLLTAPVIREEIPGGEAMISGNFSPEEARDLARNLNFGALPVPIELISSYSIGPSLGMEALSKGVFAGFVGMFLVFLFMIFWYRILGLVASLALVFYILSMLFVFKYLGVVLTAAGLAGFILSIGMAVDANILIFERIKEELKSGKDVKTSIEEGFKRAWTSIRDGNLSSLLTAIILFWFATGLVKGFALVFAIGVLLSMLSAIYVSKTLLLSFAEIFKNKKFFLKF